MLKSEIDLALSTSIQADSCDIKENEKFLLTDFTQTFQIRNKLRTPVKNIKTEVSVPSHYAQKELIQFQSSMLQLNDFMITSYSYLGPEYAAAEIFMLC